MPEDEVETISSEEEIPIKVEPVPRETRSTSRAASRPPQASRATSTAPSAAPDEGQEDDEQDMLLDDGAQTTAGEDIPPDSADAAFRPPPRKNKLFGWNNLSPPRAASLPAEPTASESQSRGRAKKPVTRDSSGEY